MKTMMMITMTRILIRRENVVMGDDNDAYNDDNNTEYTIVRVCTLQFLETAAILSAATLSSYYRHVQYT